ncbi:MAG: hypothetical protein K2H98_02265 [Duncaniella sp.]|nr:hypothetical protein [Duncaniella sp.]
MNSKSQEKDSLPSGEILTSGDFIPSSREAILSSGDSTLPRYHKRAHAHNYHAPFIYHIILNKNGTAERFGTVTGDASIAPGQAGCACIKLSRLGSIIARSIYTLPQQYPVLQVYQYMVMPDHVHILLRVKEWTEKHLDYYIATLASEIARKYSELRGNTVSELEIFQHGYCDKPLLLERSLDGLFRYIRENPHRLAMRQQYPQFFQRTRTLRIADKEYEAYGNLFLFRNPDKEAVKISRKFSSEEVEQKRARWLYDAKHGTVLVSPFISKEEKAIRSEAEALGAKIILIVPEAFPERFKPAAHNFTLCSQGRLLIISLGRSPSSFISREQCLAMNDLAEIIASYRS